MWSLENTLNVALVVYAFTALYSVFMGWVGWKQSRVKDELIKTNRLLEEILVELRAKKRAR